MRTWIRLILYTILLQLCISCSARNPDGYLTTSSNIPATNYVTASTPNSNPTVTMTPTISATPFSSNQLITTSDISSVTPSSTSIPFPNIKQKINGVLWVYDEKLSKYFVFDFATKLVSEIYGPPSGCDIEPMPNKTTVICDSGEYLYLHNLITQETNELPIPSPEWYRSSPNGSLIFYLTKETNSKPGSIYSYSLITNEIKLLAQDMQGWFYYLSANGEHLVTLDNNRLLEVIQDTREFRLIGPIEQDSQATFSVS